MEQPSLWGDFPAKTCPWQENAPDWSDSEVVCSGTSSDLPKKSSHRGSSLKTFLVCCHRTTDGTWEPSSGRWLTSGTGSATGFWTLSSSEFPSDAAACSLSDVLETTGAHLLRYSLSAKAAAGILRRATRRGKTLPERLQTALETIAG